MDASFINRYLQSTIDLPIYFIKPAGQGLGQIDTLRAGETYPIMVYDIIDAGSYRYARFKVANDSDAPYPGANYTMIPFYESTSRALPQPYVPPTPSPTVTSNIFSGILKIVAVGAVAYVLGEAVTSNKN